eukprot:529359_1
MSMSVLSLIISSQLFVVHPYTTWFNWSNPCINENVSSLPFCNESLSFEERAYDLVYVQEAKLSNSVLVYQTLSGSTISNGIPQLSIPPYQWNTNAPHGMCSAPGCNYNGQIKYTTMFPQVIGTASSFNETLFYEIGKAISTEGRAMNNYNQSGLTVWSPNINIFRDPRWGRGQETPGEDPFLTSRYAVNFVQGLQGNDNKYIKMSACCKHFVDYSLENSDGYTRHNFNANVSEYDQNDTYLVPFKYCVIEGNVSGLMCSYNAINSVPSCAYKTYLTNLIRNNWKFNGYIVSDCDATNDVINSHHYTNNSADTIRDVFSAGMDIDCSNGVSYSQTYLANSSVNISIIQKAIYHSTLIQMRLGMFDNRSNIPWSNLTEKDVTTNDTLKLSHEASQQSVVLLKNINESLPILNYNKLKVTAVIGPNADSILAMQGNDYGNAPFIYTVKTGLLQYISESEEGSLIYEQGCEIDNNDTSGINDAVAAAEGADITILVMGLDKSIEGESTDRSSTYLMLPGAQNKLIQRVSAVSNKTILVVISGGCVDISLWKHSNNINAIIYCGYCGMYGGLAIADVLFGVFNPTAKLTQTWYYNNYTLDITMDNMNMRVNLSGNATVGRGYRYFYGDVVYPFGFGISYTQFKCSNLTVNKDEFGVNIENIGKYDGGAVVLVYFVPQFGGMNGIENKRLVGFGRVNLLKNGQSENLKMKMYAEFYQSKEHSDFNGKYILQGNCV